MFHAIVSTIYCTLNHVSAVITVASGNHSINLRMFTKSTVTTGFFSLQFNDPKDFARMSSHLADCVPLQSVCQRAVIAPG